MTEQQIEVRHHELAEWFVVFAKTYATWEESRTFSEEDVKKVFHLVEAAGFEPSSVSVGVLTQRTSYGSVPVNPLCPFRVMEEEGGDHIDATRWLNELWKKVNPRWSPSMKDLAPLIEEVRTEIVRSVPLEPILIGPDGELLVEYPPENLGFFVNHTKDENEVRNCVGAHKYCNSWVDRKRASKTHDALVCRGCNLRVAFPREIVQCNKRRFVKTFGDLRIVMAMLARQNWQWQKG